MKKVLSRYVAISIVILSLAVVVVIFTLLNRKPKFQAKMQMESGAMEVVDYYYPRQIALGTQPRESNLKLPEFSSPARFGSIVLGNGADSVFSIAVEFGLDSRLYVDKNNNEDLTDDEESAWDEVTSTYTQKEVLMEVPYVDDDDEHVVPYPIVFYRHKTRLPDVLIAYRNGYREGFVTFVDSAYRVAIFDDDSDGLFEQLNRGAMVIDINRDDVLDGAADSPEYMHLSDHFNIGGNSYVIDGVSPSGHLLTFIEADSSVFGKETLSVDMRAPAFRTEAVDGQVIDLTTYRNHVVLVDFWATWCKPWEEHLSSLKRSYLRYGRIGFEIIGVSLDYDLEHLGAYLKENNISWPQIADGRGWELPLVDLYKVGSMPTNFLLDRNGVIRYKSLYGKQLESKIYELLNEPEISTETSN